MVEILLLIIVIILLAAFFPIILWILLGLIILLLIIGLFRCFFEWGEDTIYNWSDKQTDKEPSEQNEIQKLNSKLQEYETPAQPDRDYIDRIRRKVGLKRL